MQACYALRVGAATADDSRHGAPASSAQREYYGRYSATELLELIQTLEMVLFHGLVLIMQRDEGKGDMSYEKWFYEMIWGEYGIEKRRNERSVEVEDKSGGSGQTYLYVSNGKQVAGVKCQLPPEFCLSVFFSYGLIDEACKYLYWRNEHDELMDLIKGEYDRAAQYRAQ